MDVVDEAFTSEHWLVRIYKVRKARNRLVTARAVARRRSRLASSSTTQSTRLVAGKGQQGPGSRGKAGAGGRPLSVRSSRPAAAAGAQGRNGVNNRQRPATSTQQKRGLGGDGTGKQQQRKSRNNNSKKKKNTATTTTTKKKKKKKKNRAKKRQKRTARGEGAAAVRSKQQSATSMRYVGCYTNEKAFGPQRVYAGGRVGANAALARKHAQRLGKRFVAIARTNDGSFGHAFAFDRPLARYDG